MININGWDQFTERQNYRNVQYTAAELASLYLTSELQTCEGLKSGIDFLF